MDSLEAPLEPNEDCGERKALESELDHRLKAINLQHGMARVSIKLCLLLAKRPCDPALEQSKYRLGALNFRKPPVQLDTAERTYRPKFTAKATGRTSRVSPPTTRTHRLKATPVRYTHRLKSEKEKPALAKKSSAPLASEVRIFQNDVKETPLLGVARKGPRSRYAEAEHFVSEVQKRLARQPQRFTQFIGALRLGGDLSWDVVEEQIVDILDGHPDLTDTFYAFAPLEPLLKQQSEKAKDLAKIPRPVSPQPPRSIPMKVSVKNANGVALKPPAANNSGHVRMCATSFLRRVVDLRPSAHGDATPGPPPPPA